MSNLEKLQVVVDSNEFHHGNTWDFPGCSISVKSLLDYGCDYTLRGCHGLVGVERKSFNDYAICIGSSFERFKKQLEKLACAKYRCVIVEGNIDDKPHFKSRVIKEVLVTQTANIAAAYGIPILFASSRPSAELMCLKFFKKVQEVIRNAVE